MKYAVFGSGGTGGAIAAYLFKAGFDVTLISRGKALENIQKNGLVLEQPDGRQIIPLNAESEFSYNGTPDIIFICVKSYSLEQTYNFIKKTADKNTTVIPILNVYGTGDKMAQVLPGIDVLNGCIYITSFTPLPGVVRMTSYMFRIIFGRNDCRTDDKKLIQLEDELKQAGINSLYSDNIKRDTLQKYTMISPFAAAGIYYDVPCSEFQKDGKVRELYIQLIKEILAVADAMGIKFKEDVVAANLRVVSEQAPAMTSSCYKDFKKGGQSEFDGLVCEMVRLGKKYNIPVPGYEMIVSELNNKFTEDKK